MTPDDCTHTHALPPTPPTHHIPTQVVKAVGPCNEMGLAGWLLKRYPNLLQHKYYVFLDSSVRGPFLPSYVDVPWHRLLTQRITDTTKLVGATISCAPFKYNEQENGFVIYPYVLGYVTATDQIGMGVLNSTQPSVFHCFHDRLDILRFGVIGMSEAMLRNNYNIGSLMLKYQNVDFRDGSKWACNDRVDPHADGHYDGTSLNPLEVYTVGVLQGVGGNVVSVCTGLVCFAYPPRHVAPHKPYTCVFSLYVLHTRSHTPPPIFSLPGDVCAH